MCTFDLGVAWNWKYDADFVRLLGTACRLQGLSMVEITAGNLDGMLPLLDEGRVGMRVFLDRASDTDPRFLPLVRWAHSHASYHVNPYEHARRTWDKTTMHPTLMSAGLATPVTIILPAYAEHPELPPLDLSPLGDGFTIKPAHGGGGEGVITGATCIEHVAAARREHPTDKYLLQAHIVPVELNFRPAWFRVIYCADRVYPCWWDTRTHVYRMVTFAEECRYGLSPLHEIARAIALLCRLDLFSTEVALTPMGLFVIVDYVNDQIDLRPESTTFDGVPDKIVWSIAERLALLAAVYAPPRGERRHSHCSQRLA
ncbi:MAG TPA: hypothetical protein VEI04_00020 [Syntrophobacteria bacterium]|nr:hypothetical protein [Syntrophobacteria bacterium]